MNFLEKIFVALIALFVFSQIILPLLFNKQIFWLFRSNEPEEIKEAETTLEKEVADVKSTYTEVKSKVETKFSQADKLKKDLENINKKTNNN